MDKIEIARRLRKGLPPCAFCGRGVRLTIDEWKHHHAPWVARVHITCATCSLHGAYNVSLLDNTEINWTAGYEQYTASRYDCKPTPELSRAA
jgi:hypothetical protein